MSCLKTTWALILNIFRRQRKMFVHKIDSNVFEHKVDGDAFAAALAILDDFPELTSGKDKAVIAFKLFVRIKVGMKALIRDLDHMHARECPSNN